MDKHVEKRMYGRQHSRDRKKMQNTSTQQERAVATGKIGKAIKLILGILPQQYDMHSHHLRICDWL